MLTYSLKERVLLRGYTWRRRVHPPQVFGFSDALRRTDRLLICLPHDPEEARLAATVIPDLITCLQAKRVTVAGAASSISACASLPASVRVIPIGAGDRKWTGLPAAALVSRITGDGLDAVIDLNPHLDVLTGALCLQTGAPLRMCFLEPYRELFFNVQIAVSGDRPFYPPDTVDVPYALQENERARPIEDEVSSAPYQAHEVAPPTPYIRFLHTVKGMTGKGENKKRKRQISASRRDRNTSAGDLPSTRR